MRTPSNKSNFSLILVLLTFLPYGVWAQVNKPNLQSLEGKWYCVYYLNFPAAEDTITPLRSKQHITIDFNLLIQENNTLDYTVFINDSHVFDTVIHLNENDSAFVSTEKLIPDEIRFFDEIFEHDITYSLVQKSDSMLIIHLDKSEYKFVFHRDSTYQIENHYYERLEKLKQGLPGKWNWKGEGGLVHVTPDLAGYDVSVAFSEYKPEYPDSLQYQLYKNDSLYYSKLIHIEVNSQDNLCFYEQLYPNNLREQFLYGPYYGVPGVAAVFHLTNTGLTIYQPGIVDGSLNYFTLDSIDISLRKQDTLKHILARQLDTAWYFYTSGSVLDPQQIIGDNTDKIKLQFTYDSLDIENNTIACTLSVNDVIVSNSGVQISYYSDTSVTLASNVFPADVWPFALQEEVSNSIVSFSSDTALYFKPDAENNNIRYCFTKNYIEHVPTGLSKPHRNDKILIYNNFSNTLSILNSGNIQISEIELFDISGKKVYEKQVATDKTYFEMKLDNSFNGFYIVNVISNTSMFSEKIFIKHR